MRIKEIIRGSLKYSRALLKKDKRTLNELVNRSEYMRGKIVLRSNPSIYVIGITNICNLRCPLCITGLRLQQKPLKFMDIILFKQIIDKIKDYACLVQLYNWGESLLHKDIIEILEYCDRYDLNTEISSNLSLTDIDDKLESLVKYRLKHLIVSFDGIDQKDYERYRIGGNFELVLKNIKKIRELKNAYNTEYPRISLQYLRNKFTTNQADVIKENHRKWGADDYYVSDMTTVFKDRNMERNKEWFDQDEIKKRKYLDIDVSMHGIRCYFLYTTMVIDHDGTIPPCCFTTNPGDDFGLWDNNKSISGMYNSENYIKARRMFKEKHADSSLVCNNCTAFITFANKYSIGNV